jgi:predicted nucleic acid-binding protein
MARDSSISMAWADDIDNGAVGSCQPQRTEFRRSARSLDEFDEMTEMYADLFPDVEVPKKVWSWIDVAQYRLAQRGRHQCLSVVDWLISGTAAHHGLVVVHDDKDFVAASEILPDLRVINVHDPAA